MEFDNQPSSPSQTSSPDLSAAVTSISTEAPKLTGLDKLKAAKETVEKTGQLPTKDSTPAKVETSTQKTDTPVKVSPDAIVPPTYTPDFKYKAGGKEMEVPQTFRALMTDKSSEDEVKKLFGQVATNEDLKTNNATLQKNLGEVGGALNNYQTQIQELRSISQKGDWDTWFKKLNIPHEKIFQWVLDKVQYNQLAPEQRAQIDSQRDLQRQAEMAQEQVGQASHREMHLATQVKGMQLEQTLGKADVKTMADAFDSRVGKPGAFKEAIIEHGKSVWALSNYTVDLTPEQAVESFVQKYGNPSVFAGQGAAAGAAAIPAAITPGAAPAATPSANAQPPVKVIPNVAGRSASPIKQKPKSIDDLKRLRDEAVKEDNASRSPSQGYLAG